MKNAHPKILIIDDNLEKLAFLGELGFDITIINSSKESLDFVKSSETLFDLVILDLNVSSTSGWELLKLLRSLELFEVVPVIIVTDLKDKTDELLALKSGADDFIKEPFDKDILLMRIETILRRSLWNKKSFLNIRDLPFINIPEDYLKLTSREETVVNLLSMGYSNEKIAEELFLSKLTVKTHLKNIFKKLQASNRTEAILIAYHLGLIKGF
jgi:DNA-binding NarL/FixJ family response regulator